MSEYRQPSVSPAASRESTISRTGTAFPSCPVSRLSRARPQDSSDSVKNFTDAGEQVLARTTSAVT
jgi:hypothetical protein